MTKNPQKKLESQNSQTKLEPQNIHIKPEAQLQLRQRIQSMLQIDLRVLRNSRSLQKENDVYNQNKQASGFNTHRPTNESQTRMLPISSLKTERNSERKVDSD